MKENAKKTLKTQLLGTIYSTKGNYEFKFSSSPNTKIFIGDLVEFSINENKFIGKITELTNKNYLIDEDAAVELTTFYQENDKHDLNAVIYDNFRDHTVCSVEVIGRRNRDLIVKPQNTPKLGTKVFRISEDLLNETLNFHKNPTIDIGWFRQNKNIPIKIDLQELISKHFALLAMTGAGKSWTVSILVEQLASHYDIPIVIFDAHGEYSSLSVSNEYSSIDEALKAEFIKKIKIYCAGSDIAIEQRNILFEDKFNQKRETSPIFLKLTDLALYQIKSLLSYRDPLSQAQSRILEDIWSNVEQYYKNRAIIGVRNDKIGEMINDSNATNSSFSKNLLITKLENFMKNTPFIIRDASQKRLNFKEIGKKGQITVIDLSAITEINQQALVAVITEKLLNKRIKQEIDPLLCLFEEAHRYIPSGNQSTASKPTLMRIAQEGRKFGLGIGIISQRPSRLDSNVLSQCNSQIIMRITNPTDQDYVKNISEYITNSDIQELRSLTPGEAFIFGPSVILSLPVKISDERLSKHGGTTPKFVI